MATPENPRTIDEVAAAAYAVGFRGWEAVAAIALYWWESGGGNEWALNIVTRETRLNPDTGREEPNPAYLSLDVGGVGMNTYWRRNEATLADISRWMTLDGAMAEMHRIAYDPPTDLGTANFGPWNGYRNHRYLAHIAIALGAWERLDRTGE